MSKRSLKADAGSEGPDRDSPGIEAPAKINKEQEHVGSEVCVFEARQIPDMA
jgi:hypothetical protein